METSAIKEAIIKGNIEWHRHALERMMTREIPRDNVKKVLITGEVIEEYADDKPFPSFLLLGWVENQPIHVVAAFDVYSKYVFIITVYKPDLEHFEADFKTRRQYGS
jgi:hypothetical protein